MWRERESAGRLNSLVSMVRDNDAEIVASEMQRVGYQGWGGGRRVQRAVA